MPLIIEYSTLILLKTSSKIVETVPLPGSRTTFTFLLPNDRLSVKALKYSSLTLFLTIEPLPSLNFPKDI